MANFLWGNVYYQDIFAGILREEAAKDAIASANLGQNHLKDELIKRIEARWNNTFAFIGTSL